MKTKDKIPFEEIPLEIPTELKRYKKNQNKNSDDPNKKNNESNNLIENNEDSKNIGPSKKQNESDIYYSESTHFLNLCNYFSKSPDMSVINQNEISLEQNKAEEPIENIFRITHNDAEIEAENDEMKKNKDKHAEKNEEFFEFLKSVYPHVISTNCPIKNYFAYWLLKEEGKHYEVCCKNPQKKTCEKEHY